MPGNFKGESVGCEHVQGQTGSGESRNSGGGGRGYILRWLEDFPNGSAVILSVPECLHGSFGCSVSSSLSCPL